jgi:hypothetical protein
VKSPLLDKIVQAVLYEGYILYPYRSSSIKNKRERFTFGRVYPQDYSESQKGAEPCRQQTECLIEITGAAPTVELTLGFLQPMWREVGYFITEADREKFRVVPELAINGVVHQSWQEATEREVSISLALNLAADDESVLPFAFEATGNVEPLSETPQGKAAIVRRQAMVKGWLEIETTPLSARVVKLSIRVLNQTPMTAAECDDQDAVIMKTFASTHTVVHVAGGKFISLLDPAPEFELWAADCKNIGTWPVLVGDEAKGERDTMLSSPIILYDYPKIAPESSGSFFDGTEIDEILTLRVMTLTDGEKAEVRQVDEFARKILERSETASAEDFMKMHGTMREVKGMQEFFNPAQPIKTIVRDGQELKPGSRVRIFPAKRADAFDMIIAGKIGIIEAIEQDAEEGIHLALVLEDDPGKDLGFARQSGHRFFYTLDEVEPVVEEASA